MGGSAATPQTVATGAPKIWAEKTEGTDPQKPAIPLEHSASSFDDRARSNATALTLPQALEKRAESEAAKENRSSKNITQSGPPEKLYGTWIAEDVDAKIGEVKIKLTFVEEGPVKLLAWSEIPFVGQVRDLKGPYEVQGDTISSKAIRDGAKAKFSFEGEQLVLQFDGGKIVRFRRE